MVDFPEPEGPEMTMGRCLGVAGGGLSVRGSSERWGGGGGGTCRSHCDAISECFGAGELQLRARSRKAGIV